MEYSFSRHWHRVGAPDFDPTWLQQNHAGATRLPLFRHLHFILDVLRSLPSSVAQRLGSGLKGLVLLRRGMVTQIESIRSGHDTSHASSTHSTIFHDILSSKLPEHEKTTVMLAEETQSLIAAGTETTSWTLTVATFYLLANPSILRKLKEELRSVDPKAEGHTPNPTILHSSHQRNPPPRIRHDAAPATSLPRPIDLHAFRSRTISKAMNDPSRDAHLNVRPRPAPKHNHLSQPPRLRPRTLDRESLSVEVPDGLLAGHAAMYSDEPCIRGAIYLSCCPFSEVQKSVDEDGWRCGHPAACGDDGGGCQALGGLFSPDAESEELGC